MTTYQMLEAALKENDENLSGERRSSIIVELMIARMEIYKSMILILQRQDNERKAA